LVTYILSDSDRVQFVTPAGGECYTYCYTQLLYTFRCTL